MRCGYFIVIMQSDGKPGVLMDCCKERYAELKSLYGESVQSLKELPTVKAHCGYGKCIHLGRNKI